MSISIETPDGPVVVDLTQDEYRRASSIWDPRARPSPLGGAGDEQEDIESNGDPVGNIIGSCIELCLDRIADLRESDAAMDGHDELENWELELNTWKLCEFLFPWVAVYGLSLDGLT